MEASLQSPEELLSLLQKGPDERSPDLQDLMSAVQRMQAGAAPADQPDQVLVFPDPGFVVKTLDEEGRKVFINVCGSDRVALPEGGWADGKVPEDARRQLESIWATKGSSGEDGSSSGAGLSSGGLLGEGSSAQQGGAAGQEDTEVLRIPLSMAAPREDADVKGERCTVLDCVVNSEMLRLAGEYRPLKLFLIQLVLSWAAQKNGMQLDPRYKLPKMRYKGDAPHPHYIRADKAAQQGQQAQRKLISEVEPPEGEAPAFPLLAAGSKAPRKAANTLAAVAGDAAQQQRALGKVAAAPAAAGPAAAVAASATAAVSPALAGSGSARAASAAAAAQSNAAASGPAQGGCSSSSGPALQYSLEYVGRPVEAVRLAVQIPGSSRLGTAAASAPPSQLDPSSISVDLSRHGHVVHVGVPGCSPLTVELPFAVAAAGASAEVAQGGRQLLLQLPFRPFRDLYNQLQERAPLKFGSLGLTTSSLLELD